LSKAVLTGYGIIITQIHNSNVAHKISMSLILDVLPFVADYLV